MKHTLTISLVLALAPLACHALNPVVQTIYPADPGAMAPGWLCRRNPGTGDLNNDFTASNAW